MLDFFFRFKIITPDPTHPDQLKFPSKSVHDLGNKYPVIKVNLSGGVYYIYTVSIFATGFQNVSMCSLFIL